MKLETSSKSMVGSEGGLITGGGAGIDIEAFHYNRDAFSQFYRNRN